MKLLVTCALLLVAFTDPFEVARINKLKTQAAEAFQRGAYEEAKGHYSMLYDSLRVDDPALALNLAHCHLRTSDTTNAKLGYQAVSASGNTALKSLAYQQLGVMAREGGDLRGALSFFKSALKANTQNTDARYNYEVVKKLLDKQQQDQDNKKDSDNQDSEEEEKDQEKQEQNQEDQQNEDQQDQDQQNQEEQGQDQQDQDQQDQDQQDQEEQKDQGEDSESDQGEQKEEQQQKEEGEPEEGEQSEDQQPSTKEKLEEMNISEEKARMILEAMKNNEIQYIQQQRRKATQPKESGKPDW